MIRQILLVGAIAALGLNAAHIDFQYADSVQKRVAPSNSRQILSFNDSIKKAMHSVVNISTKKTTRTNFAGSPLGRMFNDPFFRQFFGQNFGGAIPKERVERSLGSGVILSSDGYIVTNNHVVENADEIIVAIGESDKEYNAEIIGSDKDSDLALIKIDAKGLEPIKIAGSDKLLVGDVVFAIGNPFGVGQTVTQGIVSAKNRDRVGINRYENFIQTDASINPGNSGGALIDSRGVLVGINSAILTRSGGNNGVGFAIPAAMVKDVTSKLAKSGKVERGYLGVSIQDLSKDAKEVYEHKKGALILNVAEDTPAAKAGLKRGDLIYAVDGKKVEGASELTRIIGSYNPGEEIALYIERDGDNMKLDLQLASRQNAMSASENGLVEGLKLSQINRDIARKFRLPSGVNGVLVVDVEPNSEAEKLGFQPGDIIIQIESSEIETLGDLSKALKRYNGKKRVYINRYGQTLMQILE